jgi:glycosyltransferase involved in cell wall biosynthesis
VVLKEKPDVFLSYHVKGSTPDFFGPLLGAILNKPYFIFDGNHCMSEVKNINSGISCHAVKNAFSKAAHIFQNKTNAYHTSVRNIGIDRVSYVKPGINLDDFGKYSRPVIRERYRLNDDVPIISSNAMCRTGCKADSIRFLIDCLERLKSKSIKFVWIHAGGDGEYDDLKDYAENKLGDLAIMPGTMEKNDVHALMQASDIFAFPGINETLGMVYLEAQYYETPVVAFDNGGISEVVKNNVTGILVPPMDMDAYVNAIESLLSDPVKREDMGREARKSVIQDHDINKNYRIILDVIEA